MAVTLQKLREVVFQLLYCRSFEDSDWDALIPMVMRQLTISKKTVKEAQSRAQEVWDLREDLDARIAPKIKQFSIEKIAPIEQAILRLGAYELIHSDLPPKVALAEAIRITRKFATREGGSFINGVLDALYQETLNNSCPQS